MKETSHSMGKSVNKYGMMVVDYLGSLVVSLSSYSVAGMVSVPVLKQIQSHVVSAFLLLLLVLLIPKIAI